MKLFVLMDTGILGLITQPNAKHPKALACNRWARELIVSGSSVLVSEIADHEIRRELIRLNRDSSLRRLDPLASSLGYLPLSTAAIRKAAEFWATGRQGGFPTAAEAALDGDVILAGQAFDAARSPGDEVVVATANVGHLARYVNAQPWESIRLPPELDS